MSIGPPAISFHPSILKDFEKKINAWKSLLFLLIAAGFFNRIHSFCIMGNHFHILATGMKLEAQKATTEQLKSKYRSGASCLAVSQYKQGNTNKALEGLFL
jgi:REP element-mobilizing transposase RayT